MVNQILFPLSLVVIILCFPNVFAQAQAPAQPPVTLPPPVAPVTLPPPVAPVAQPPPVAPVAQPPAQVQPVTMGPAPAGPTNLTAILEKAGHFTTLIRLLRSTQIDAEIYKQLNDSSQGLTVFAPTDNAFGNLTQGILNSYSDQQKFQLVKFHLLPSFFSLPEFQTVSNPMSTEAGSNSQYPLNVTTTGSVVNVSTGVVNVTVDGTVYTDNQLAVYQVDQVLLPLSFFVTPAPAPAPSLLVPKKKAPSPSAQSTSNSDDSDTSTTTASGAIRLAINAMSLAGFVVAALSLCA
ncbi:fasciclin-like arabinogalactan protein 11 [Diospyros lotus]|uniref:fasciclin-like arabinogalactan protein 11 n=1 Tax=Diospyros lotus TaxID=55363 RepID=UPI00225BB2F5|nr:fasciclin-like arabinogalactan protein 11 [Diospyros lotus]